MTGEQFDLLVELMGGNASTAASKAARLVLVDKVKPSVAGHQTGATRSTVFITTRRYSAAHEKVRLAYVVGGESDHPKTDKAADTNGAS